LAADKHLAEGATERGEIRYYNNNNNNNMEFNTLFIVVT
jgi:hypothetical protein